MGRTATWASNGVVAWAAWSLLAGASSGCSDDGTASPSGCVESDKLDKTAVLQVQDGTTGGDVKPSYDFDISTLSSGASKQISLTIRNSAPAVTARVLQVKSVTAVETTAGGEAVTAPQFECLGPGDKPCSQAAWPAIVPAGFDSKCAPSGAANSAALVIRYTRSGPLSARKFKVSMVVSGDVAYGDKVWTVEVNTRLGVPSVSCAPNPADFGKVGLAEAASTTVVCINQGKAEAVLSDLKVLGSLPMDIEGGGKKFSAANPLPAGQSLTIAPGDTLNFVGSFAKLPSEQKMSAILRMQTNDPTKPQLDLTYQVNATGPCVSVSKTQIDFGVSPVGTPVAQEVQIKSCGAEDLCITGAEIASGVEQGFSVGFATACFGGVAPTPSACVKVPQGAVCSLQAIYAAPQLGAISAGKLVIHTSGGDRTVLLKGQGVQTLSCPKACMSLKVADTGAAVVGQAVIPQTNLLLDGSCSTPGASGQPIVKYKWTVTQPKDSYSTLVPSDSVKTPQFQPNSAGEYLISLDVIDNGDVHACQPATYQLSVTSDDKLHIELTWDTPGDPDKLDTGDKSKGKKPDGSYAGTDMDLHLAHAEASDQSGQKDYDKNGKPDPWFAVCYDCSVFNAFPKWDDYGNFEDDPRLDRDDKDGWGPENINIRVPPAGSTYTIGVLYNASHSFGKSTPTVRVYLDGQLTAFATKTGPEMTEGDLWCAAKVSCAPNKVSPCDGADASGSLLTHKYPVVITGSLQCP